MNTDIETVSVETATPILVHGRSVEDLQGLKSNFDLNKLGNPKFTVGLTVDSQMKLLEAAKNGTRIVSTGLPLDIAAKVGEVTIVRAWDRVREDGSKTTGSLPPVDIFSTKIHNRDAFEALKATPEWAAAFTEPEPDEPAF